MQFLHFKWILWWVLTNVYTRVTTTSVWYRTFPSLQKLLLWPFAFDPPHNLCLRQTLISSLSLLAGFAWSGASYNWNHIGSTLSCLAFFTQHNVLDSFILLHVSAVNSLLLLSSIPLFDDATVQLSTHQLVNIWIRSNLERLWIKLLWIVTRNFFCEYTFSFLLGKCLWLKSLSSVLSVWLILGETTKWFSKVVAPFYHP